MKNIHKIIFSQVILVFTALLCAGQGTGVIRDSAIITLNNTASEETMQSQDQGSRKAWASLVVLASTPDVNSCCK